MKDILEGPIGALALTIIAMITFGSVVIWMMSLDAKDARSKLVDCIEVAQTDEAARICERMLSE